MTFRQASRSEFRTAIEWAADEGWNPGLDDEGIFWGTDPHGFVCAERDGEIIATGSIVNYGRFGFMGFFIVRPDLRGQGIGREFWHWRRDRLRERLGPGGVIGMDGVFNMQPFYARGGFVFSHRNLRMEGVGANHPPDPGVVVLAEIGFEAVANFDARHFGCRRDVFLKRWIAPPHGHAYGLPDGDGLRGMGVIRRCRSGCKIGPLFADDADTAQRLFAALSRHAVDEPLFLDVPEPNRAAMDLARGNGMKEVFGCARMYLGPAPALPLAGTYGITTFELG
jgi:GNAT superfamily N-acetyltransferase